MRCVIYTCSMHLGTCGGLRGVAIVAIKRSLKWLCSIFQNVQPNTCNLANITLPTRSEFRRVLKGGNLPKKKLDWHLFETVSTTFSPCCPVLVEMAIQKLPRNSVTHILVLKTDGQATTGCVWHCIIESSRDGTDCPQYVIHYRKHLSLGTNSSLLSLTMVATNVTGHSSYSVLVTEMK